MYVILGRPMEKKIREAHASDLPRWRFAREYEAEIVASSSSSQCEYGETSEICWAMEGNVYGSGNFAVASASAIARIACFSPERLAEHVWGDYFLVVLEKRRGRFLIFSDPCGQRPVFYHRASSGEIHVGTCIRDFITHAGVAREPDTDYLHQFLIYGHGDATATAWRDISLLPPGMALHWTCGQALRTQRFWSPWRKRPSGLRAEFIDLLALVLPSMLRERQTIFLELSGGLDSTALAVALRRSGLHRRTIAITHFDPQRAASNEVAVARAVASHCGIEHRTWSLLRRLPFSPVEGSALVASPATALCFLARERDMRECAYPANDGVLLNGNGGDSLYLAPPPLCVPLDALGSLHWRRALSSILDLAILYRVPLWSVLIRGLRGAGQHLGGAFGHPAQGVVKYSGVRRLTGSYDDVLQTLSLRTKPARRYQIALLAATLADGLVQGEAEHARTVMPFLSQPIVEHAMSVDLADGFSSEHSRVGVRRSVYRMSGLENLWRTDKGDIMHCTLLGIRENARHLSDVCLEGWCATSGLIDIDGMRKLLKRAALGYPTGLQEITRIYAIQMFIQGMRDA
jgi:asparagine synthase (glutamine-hydrolysing)